MEASNDLDLVRNWLKLNLRGFANIIGSVDRHEHYWPTPVSCMCEMCFSRGLLRHMRSGGTRLGIA